MADSIGKDQGLLLHVCSCSNQPEVLKNTGSIISPASASFTLFCFCDQPRMKLHPS